MRYSIAAAAVLLTLSLHAQERTFMVQEEDDSIVRTSLRADRGYTNGTRLLWRWTPEDDSRLGKLASALCRHDGSFVCERSVTAGLGQNMYTPENLRSRAAIRGDRPYGGWLYATLMLDAARAATIDHVELYAGVIGRDSHADDAQIFVHQHVTPQAPDPLGWDTQMGEWAALLGRYERRWKLLPRAQLTDRDRPHSFDVTPAIGGAAGNVAVSANASTTVRLGYNLPGHFVESIFTGVQALHSPAPGAPQEARREPPPNWDAYVYVVANASYVARNVFIDAEDERYRIERRPWVKEHRAGFSVRRNRFRFTYQYTHVSSEFRPLIRRIAQPDRPHSYGMVMLSFGPGA
jgi:lipid A 3-O-deacylase